MNQWLEIGPGENRLAGSWVTIDAVPRSGIVDRVCRWGEEPFPFADDSLELVYAAHVLEHVPWYQTLAALREAYRVLQPGGVLEIHVPDFDVLAAAAVNQCSPDQHAEGGLNAPLHWMHWVAERLFHLGPAPQWHRACFNGAHLEWCLEQAGFTQIELLRQERGTSHGLINLGRSAVKPGAPRIMLPGAEIPAGGSSQSPANPPAPLDDPRLQPRAAVVPGAEGLPLCASRREHDAQAHVFFCAHPQVHVEGGLVTAAICRICERWKQPPPAEFRPYPNVAGVVRRGLCWYLGEQQGLRNCPTCRGQVQLKVFACQHADHESTTLDDCLRCPDYDQRLWLGKIKRWSVGVTTAPRARPTLARTLASLASAGWEQGLIFAEPGSPLGPVFPQSQVVSRSTTLGAWPNWFLGLSELYQRDPQADAYFMVQDDVVFCRNLRAYLEETLWPQETLGVVSLYNPTPQLSATAGFSPFPPGNCLPGALALIFSNTSARLLLSDHQVLLHRRRGPSAGLKFIDLTVAAWCERTKLSAWIHAPSLCQHIGETTTIWPAGEDAVIRQAVHYVGEDFDALSWLAAVPPPIHQP